MSGFVLIARYYVLVTSSSMSGDSRSTCLWLSMTSCPQTFNRRSSQPTTHTTHLCVFAFPVILNDLHLLSRLITWLMYQCQFIYVFVVDSKTSSVGFIRYSISSFVTLCVQYIFSVLLYMYISKVSNFFSIALLSVHQRIASL